VVADACFLGFSLVGVSSFLLNFGAAAMFNSGSRIPTISRYQLFIAFDGLELWKWSQSKLLLELTFEL